MAANDYHVIMYEILLYLYDCLKKDISPSREEIETYRQRHEINRRYWSRVIKDMDEYGYIQEIQGGQNDADIACYTIITSRGIDYLTRNPLMNAVRDKGADAIQIKTSDIGGAILE